MREIKRQFCLRWDEFLVVIVAQAAAFLLGQIMLAVIINLTGENEVFTIGTVLALAIPLIILVFMGMSVMVQCFNMGISMGGTRKYFALTYIGMSFLECLVIVGIAYLLYQIEKWICRTVYAAGTGFEDIDIIFQWKYILPACLGIVAIQLFFGTLFIKYGKIAFWIFWSLWMIVCIGGSRITDFVMERAGAYQAVFFISRISETSVLTGISVLAVIVSILSYLMLRRQQVNL